MKKNLMRNSSIDIARGLAILVVISWHIIGKHSPWTDGWVMPIFFVIMGMFYHHTPSFKILLKKKVCTLLIPHFFCSVPAFAISLFNNGLNNTLKVVLNPYACINPVSWFLVSMFFCYLIYWSVNQIAKDSVSKRVIMSFVISILGFYSSRMHLEGLRVVLPFFISTSLTVMAFIEVGHLIGLSRLATRRSTFIYANGGGGAISKHTIISILLLIIFVLDVFLLRPSSGNMMWNCYDSNYQTFIINGIIGSLFIIKICDVLHHLLLWIAPIGRLSLLMLVLHMYVYHTFSYMDITATISYIITVALTMLIALILETKFSFVLGKF